MTVEPLKPEDVVNAKKYQIPDEVFEAFNVLIAKNFYNYSAAFTQDEAVEEILRNLRTSDLEILKDLKDRKDTSLKRVIFDNHWLDIEEIYRKAGWKVTYDKPAYNESYDANFDFEKKKNND